MAFRDDLYTGNIQKRVDDIKSRPGERWINEFKAADKQGALELNANNNVVKEEKAENPLQAG